MNEQQYRDKHGDEWLEDAGGLMHSYETAPFPREYVEKKWGPLVRIERPVPTTDNQQRRLRVIDIDQGVIDEGNNEVTFVLSDLDEQPVPSLPTREQIAEALWREENAAPSDVVTGTPWLRSSYFNQAAAVLALLQKTADR